MVGTIFLFIGFAACTMAAIRGRAGARVLFLAGIFSGMYGARILAQYPAGFSIFPQAIWASRQEFFWVITYLIPIPAVLFWVELSVGKLRRLLQIMLVLFSAVGMGGLYSVLIARSPERLLPYNDLLVIAWMLVLAVVSLFPRMTRRYLTVHSGVLATGTLAFAAAAFYTNLEHFLNLVDIPGLEPLAFGVLVFSLGYVALEKVFTLERRLLSIDNELAIAREIQSSILPSQVPELDDLQIAAAYRPMTAVAGDFYEFIPVDRKRAGFLVADVSGHGVPAALIASMIKVAAQSVVSRRDDPPAVLRGLNRSLSPQLRGQLISAAYLWIDCETQQALYSAAGHPPLLRWRNRGLEPIESNGLLLGVAPDAEYPVRDVPLRAGDRFLLYTDGLTEPENASGEAFGDSKLEQVLSHNQSCSPSELSDQLLSEVRRWQPVSMSQQDDITLIIIDVVMGGRKVEEGDGK